MKYLRKLKIYCEFEIKPKNDERFNELIEFIESIFKGVKKYVIEDKNSLYFNDILYKNDKNKIIFLHELKTGYFHIDSNLIWSIFEKKFDYSYTDIQQLMKYILFKKFKLRKIRPTYALGYHKYELFKNYKLSSYLTLV